MSRAPSSVAMSHDPGHEVVASSASCRRLSLVEEKSAWSLGPEQAQKLQGCLRRSAQASHLSGGYRRSEGSPGSQGWSVWDSSTLWKPA